MMSSIISSLRDLGKEIVFCEYLSEEAKEAKNSFVEKRKPDFSKYPKFP